MLGSFSRLRKVCTSSDVNSSHGFAGIKAGKHSVIPVAEVAEPVFGVLSHFHESPLPWTAVLLPVQE